MVSNEKVNFGMLFRLIRFYYCGIIYLHRTERMTAVPLVLKGELEFNSGCTTLQPNDAWLSCAVGRNLTILVTILHPSQASLEDSDSVGDDSI